MTTIHAASPILIGLVCNKIASNEALTVRPVYKTSSMITTTLLLISTLISKARVALPYQRHLENVISIVPVGTNCCSIEFILSCIRCAKKHPSFNA